MATWCVASMVRAPQRHLERFVEHYSALGAHRIYLFHDDPGLASVIVNRKVKNVICDDEYWQGKRPDDSRTRQRTNATRASKWTDAEWILHCDHDEFILSDRPVSEMLGSLDDNVMSVLAPPIEAVYDAEPNVETCYDTPWFKRPMRTWWGVHPILLECFGDAARLTAGGLTGHLEGKSFTRRSRYAGRIPVHSHGTAPEGLVANLTLPSLALMHFDCLTFADWREKNLRRISKQIISDRVPRLRVLQWEAVIQARDRGGDEALHELYLRLNVLNAEAIGRGQEAGFIQFVGRRYPDGPARSSGPVT